MKARDIKNFYLPKNISKHVKYILLCAVFTPLLGLIIQQDINSFFLIIVFITMFVSIEIIAYIASKIFIFSAKTRNEITRIYLLRLVLFFSSALITTVLIFVLSIIAFYLFKGLHLPDLNWFINHIINVIGASATAYLIITPFIFFKKWQQAMKSEYGLREQNLIFQNETLKSQVNPHFLFNSLNTLSSLVNSQIEIAGQFISMLSKIYRYILENGQMVKVPLKNELAFIIDYFYMHEIRNEGKIHLFVDINNDNNYEILPVSLQLLIENAIKHNMATLEKPLNINIYLEGQDIVVRNNIQKIATQVASTKIGLKNLNERVRLITGKEIIIQETTTEFLVKVPLIL